MRYAYEDEEGGPQVFTPAQALYDALLTTGWVHKKSDFAEMVEVGMGNVYNYLPAPDGERKTRPLAATVETIHSWIGMVRQKTGLMLQIVCLADGSMELEVTGGKTRAGAKVARYRYRVKSQAADSPVQAAAAG